MEKINNKRTCNTATQGNTRGRFSCNTRGRFSCVVNLNTREPSPCVALVLPLVLRCVVLFLLIFILYACNAYPTDGENNNNGKPGVLPTAEPELIIWYPPGNIMEDHDLVLEALNERLAERLNVKLDLRMTPFGEYNEKMMLITTSGEVFDLMYVSNWMNSFVINVAMGMLTPLDDLLERYGADIKAALPPWVFDAGMAGDILYAIPNFQMVGNYYGVYILKEYADKYSLDVANVRSLPDLFPFLEEIVQNEPGMIPLFNQQQATLYNDYETLAGGLALYRKGDTSFTILPYIDLYAAEAHFQNNMYKRRFIQEDIITTYDPIAYHMANRYVVTHNIYLPGIDANISIRYGGEYIAIPFGECYITNDSGATGMTAISSTSPSPESAMRFYNLIYTDRELFNMLLYGIEGLHYTMSGPESVELLEPGRYNYGTTAWAFGNQLIQYYMPGQRVGLWEETLALMERAEKSLLRGFNFDASPVQTEITQSLNVMQDFNNQQYVVDDVDAWILDLNLKLHAAGLGDVVAELQRQVDAWAIQKGLK